MAPADPAPLLPGQADTRRLAERRCFPLSAHPVNDAPPPCQGQELADSCKLQMALGHLTQQLPSLKRKKSRGSVCGRSAAAKCASAGASPVSTPLAGRAPPPFFLPPPSTQEKTSSLWHTHQQHQEDKEQHEQQHHAKGSPKILTTSPKGEGSCGRTLLVSQAFLAALVVVAFCSLVFFALFAPYLARMHEPLVLLRNGGERIVIRVRSASDPSFADPVADLSHPHLAGRRELLRYFDDGANSWTANKK